MPKTLIKQKDGSIKEITTIESVLTVDQLNSRKAMLENEKKMLEANLAERIKQIDDEIAQLNAILTGE